MITFADPPPSTEPPPPPPTPVVDVTLPDGLYLTVVNDTLIRFEESAIGDPVKGYLLENAKLKGQTIVPRGAIVHGRITSTQKFLARTEVFRLGIKLTEIEFPGARANIDAILEEVTPLPGWSRAGADKQGMIYISGSRPAFPRGVRTVWRLRSDTGKANK